MRGGFLIGGFVLEGYRTWSTLLHVKNTEDMGRFSLFVLQGVEIQFRLIYMAQEIARLHDYTTLQHRQCPLLSVMHENNGRL